MTDSEESEDESKDEAEFMEEDHKMGHIIDERRQLEESEIQEE